MNINSILNFSHLSKYFVPSNNDMPDRRFDLDWLRVGVFGLLILFHTGMFYVESWPWHVKSEHLSQFLENIMLLVEPWRMGVLWVISGIAIRFVMVKVSVWRFISMRTLRLLLPLLFGVLIIVPPQLYIEMTFNGDLNMNFWQFLQAFFSSDSTVFDKYQYGIWQHFNANHLWFIAALWKYSLFLLCLLPLLNTKLVNSVTDWLFKQYGLLAIFIAVLPIFFIQMNWELDSVRYPLGFTLMVYGYLIGWNKIFWQRIKENLRPLLVIALIFYCLLIALYNLVWLDMLKNESLQEGWVYSVIMFNYSMLRLIGVLTVFSFAHNFLNKKSHKLTYFNDAVYPFYILHQTLIVVIGFNLSKLDLGPVYEPMLLISLTTLGCFIGYEFIRRTEILRPFFGLKMSNNYSNSINKLGYISASLVMLPLAWQIIA